MSESKKVKPAKKIWERGILGTPHTPSREDPVSPNDMRDLANIPSAKPYVYHTSASWSSRGPRVKKEAL